MKLPGLGLAAIAAMLGSPPPPRDGGLRFAMRQRLHDTKPFETTAEARKRKKAERQAKKEGRRNRR